MSRGSKIGERRGGRDRGTPNGRTRLVDRILAIASECLATSAEGFIAVLVQDQKIPADIRMAIAPGTSHSASSTPIKINGRKTISGPRAVKQREPGESENVLGIVLDTLWRRISDAKRH